MVQYIVIVYNTIYFILVIVPSTICFAAVWQGKAVGVGKALCSLLEKHLTVFAKSLKC